MSTVLILTPIIIAHWPAIVAAVGAAAASMGLSVNDSLNTANNGVPANTENTAEIELEESQALTDTVTEGQEIRLTRGNVQLTVHRNAQGAISVCATGKGKTKAELETLAKEFSERMSQCFIYNKVMTELRAKGFQVVHEEQMEDQSLRINVRRWEE